MATPEGVPNWALRLPQQRLLLLDLYRVIWGQEHP